MIKIETIRKITKGVIGTSVWWTVGNIIDNNLTPNNRYQKVEAYLGSAAIGWVVREQANLYIDKQFDKLIEGWKNKDIHVEVKIDPIQDEVEPTLMQNIQD
jgi:hypothetical protein